MNNEISMNEQELDIRHKRFVPSCSVDFDWYPRRLNSLRLLYLQIVALWTYVEHVLLSMMLIWTHPCLIQFFSTYLYVGLTNDLLLLKCIHSYMLWSIVSNDKSLTRTEISLEKCFGLSRIDWTLRSNFILDFDYKIRNRSRRKQNRIDSNNNGESLSTKSICTCIHSFIHSNVFSYCYTYELISTQEIVYNPYWDVNSSALTCNRNLFPCHVHHNYRHEHVIDCQSNV
jgi:hypothetical protein